MKPTFYIMILLLYGTTFHACKDKDDTPPPTPPKPPIASEERLPPITTTGAGTFGCKVNGKVWVAKSNKTGWSPTYASVNKNNNWLVSVIGMIMLNNSTDQAVIITFYNSNSNYYPLYLREEEYSAGIFDDGRTNKFWGTDSVTGGRVNISRFDTLNQILSGTFYFDCINKETNDTLHITDGRFDMHYTY